MEQIGTILIVLSTGIVLGLALAGAMIGGIVWVDARIRRALGLVTNADIDAALRAYEAAREMTS